MPGMARTRSDGNIVLESHRCIPARRPSRRRVLCDISNVRHEEKPRVQNSKANPTTYKETERPHVWGFSQHTADVASRRYKVCRFVPGALGIVATWSDGIITDVPASGQGARAGVKKGWLFFQINGFPYSEQLLNAHIKGRASFEVTFSFVDPGNVTVLFQPGLIGIRALWPTGTVLSVVAGSQAERHNVKPGWIFLKINGTPYSEKLLDAHVKRHLPFQVTFAVGDMIDIFRDVGDWRGKHQDAFARVAGVQVMDAFVSHLDQMASTTPSMFSIFHTRCPLNMFASEYVKRLRDCFGCDDECFIIALVYMDRIAKTHPTISIDRNSIHRMLVSCVLLGIKFHQDDHLSNHDYANMAGLSRCELDYLERQTVGLLNWKLFVSVSDYAYYVNRWSKDAI